MMRSLLSAFISFACIVCVSAHAGSFPAVVDARVIEYDDAASLAPELLSSPDGLIHYFSPMDDFDDDGIDDYILHFYSDAFYSGELDAEAIEALDCPPMYLVPSSTTGSTIVLTDLVEITGLEVWSGASEDIFDCLSGYLYPEQIIRDINGDGIDELVFYNPVYSEDGGVDRVEAIVAFGNVTGGSSINLNNAAENIEGFILPENTFVPQTVGDVDGDGINDLALLTASFNEDFSEFSSALRVISGSYLRTGSSWSFESIDDSGLIFELDTNSFLEVAIFSDFNGDSFSDFIINEYQPSGEENRYIIYGSPGLAIDESRVGLNLFLPTESGCSSYCNVAPAGDFNADGFDDLLISGFGVDGSSENKIVLLFGGASGLPESIEPNTSALIQSSDAGGVGVSSIAYEDAENVGDINVDGASDFLVSSGEGAFQAIIFGQTLTSPEAIEDIQVSELDGDNGVLLLPDDFGYYAGFRIADINNDGIDDIGSQHDNRIILQGQSVSARPQGVQDLVIATGHAATFISWSAPDPSHGDLQLSISVDGRFIDAVDASTAYYKLTDPAPNVGAVLSVKYINSLNEESPAQRHPLSNAYQGLQQLRASVYSDNAVELFWGNEASQYYVWRNGSKIAEVNGNSFYDDTVQPGVNYYYHITQGPNAAGLNLGRSTSLPIYHEPSICFSSDCPIDVIDVIDGSIEDYSYYYGPDYCPSGDSHDYRNSLMRSLFPASTDELLVVTGSATFEYSTPAVDFSSVDCVASQPFQISYGYHEQYSSTALEVFWDRASHSSGVVTYEVTRDGEVVYMADATSYYDGDIGSNVLYEYKVTAIAGDGSRSVPIVISVYLPENDGGYLAEIEGEAITINLSAIVYSSSAAELFWDTVYDATGNAAYYQVWRDGELVQVSDGLSFFDSSLVEGQSYLYEVEALSQDRIIGTASTLVNTAGDITTPTPVSVLPADARADVYSNSAIELFWSQADDPFYQSGLTANTYYDFSIQALDADGGRLGSAAVVSARTKN